MPVTIGQILIGIGTGFGLFGGGGLLAFVLKGQNKKIDDAGDLVKAVYASGVFLKEKDHEKICKINELEIKDHITKEVQILNTTMISMKDDMFNHLRSIEKKIDNRNGNGKKKEDKEGL